MPYLTELFLHELFILIFWGSLLLRVYVRDEYGGECRFVRKKLLSERNKKHIGNISEILADRV